VTLYTTQQKYLEHQMNGSKLKYLLTSYGTGTIISVFN